MEQVETGLKGSASGTGQARSVLQSDQGDPGAGRDVTPRCNRFEANAYGLPRPETARVRDRRGKETPSKDCLPGLKGSLMTGRNGSSGGFCRRRDPDKIDGSLRHASCRTGKKTSQENPPPRRPGSPSIRGIPFPSCLRIGSDPVHRTPGMNFTGVNFT